MAMLLSYMLPAHQSVTTAPKSSNSGGSGCRKRSRPGNLMDALAPAGSAESPSVRRKKSRSSLKKRKSRRDNVESAASSEYSSASPGLSSVGEKRSGPSPPSRSTVASSASGRSTKNKQAQESTGKSNHNFTIEQQAVSFFLNAYIHNQPGSLMTSIGYLELLPQMYNDEPLTSPLRLATEALSVRIFAHFNSNPNLLTHANLLYGHALHAAQRAITDPTSATADETLLSILIFTLYESLTLPSTETWSQHVQGAITIIEARGIEQFANQRSLILFRATRELMLIDALGRRKFVPPLPWPAGWYGDQPANASSGGVADHSYIGLIDVLAKADVLLSRQGAAASTADVSLLLEAAYDVQTSLLEAEVNMPPQHAYRSHFHPAPGVQLTGKDFLESPVYRPGAVHLYKDLHSAGIRSSNRTFQFLCTGIIVDALQWLFPDEYAEDRQYQAAVYRLQYLADDIAASIPFHMGYRVAREARPPPEPGPIQRPINETGGYFLIWPLQVACSRLEVPERQRHWLQAKLQVVGERYGLRQGHDWPQVISDVSRTTPNSLETSKTQRAISALGETMFQQRLARLPPVLPEPPGLSLLSLTSTTPPTSNAQPLDDTSTSEALIPASTSRSLPPEFLQMVDQLKQRSATPEVPQQLDP